MVISFGYHFNLERWIYENSTNIIIVESIDSGLIFNRKYNKTILIFANESLEDVYFKNNQDLYQINSTILSSYEDIDLFAIELSEKYQNNLDLT